MKSHFSPAQLHPARAPGESQEAYKRRRAETNQAIRIYLREGRMLWPTGGIHIWQDPVTLQRRFTRLKAKGTYIRAKHGELQ